MSEIDPVEDFENLNLGGMPVSTRRRKKAREQAEAQGAAESAAHPATQFAAAAVPSLASPEHQDTPEIDEITSANSRLTYNVGHLKAEVQARLRQGLDATDVNLRDWSEIKGKTKASGAYGFELTEYVSVHVGGQGSEYSVPTCTCGGTAGETACKHIFWLEDQLALSTPEESRPGVIRLEQDGSSLSGRSPYDLLNRVGPSQLFQNSHERRAPTASQEEEQEHLDNLLAVLDPSDTLLDEPQEPVSPGQRLQEETYARFSSLLKQRFTLTDLLGASDLADDDTIPVCLFFERVRSQAYRALAALDEYIIRGENTPQPALSVAHCAARLEALVHQIGEKYEECSPLTQGVQYHAAAALVSILEGVVERDYDAESYIQWRSPQSPSFHSATERNLYDRLIRNPPASGPGAGGRFVVDTLFLIPPDAMMELGERLESMVRLKIDRQGACAGFSSEMGRILRRKRKGAGIAGGSSSKKTKG